MLISVYTALLVTCGLDCRIGLAVAAAATTASVNANRATCGPGSDQPHCDDPSYQDGAPQAQGQHQHTDVELRATNSPKDRGFCAAGGAAGGKDCTKKQHTRFQSGDVIELYNTESRDIQIVFPSIVKVREPGTGGYTVTKTTDGKEVTNVPEKFLHMYVPYQEGAEVLCNIGEFKPARPIIVRCTVLGYDPAASRGAMMLQGTYSVQVHATKANEEYVTNLPVWKLQRRYLASATATA